ncbi:hypothetical protein [Streptosporangium sp. NPDC002524]|uniref:hypothetical protein n=1 Tax=Streptosporangium sp. NPDC002524 TaxID=3154537 RepID=UPI0033178E91
MAKDKTSVSLDPWVLALARGHAEGTGVSVSTLITRGILREIAATHDPRARAVVYGEAAVPGQEADEHAMAEDIAQAVDERRAGGAAA